MRVRTLSAILLTAAAFGSAQAADPRACGLPQAFDPFMGALPGRVVTLSGGAAQTFWRVAELAEEPFERVVVLLHGGDAKVLAIVNRGNLVCARRLTLSRDKAQWGLNMAFGEEI
jgi:hypothetical protein